MTNELEIRSKQVFADAYHTAAMAEADMTGFAAVLEPVRLSWTYEKDALQTRSDLDNAVSKNTDPAAEEALQQLRDAFSGWQKDCWLQELIAQHKQSPDKAWSLFLHHYAYALQHWRTRLMWWWADAASGQSPENATPLFADRAADMQRFREQSRLIEHGRWPEAYPFLRELAGNERIEPRLRAQLWTVCAAIQMHFNTLPDARRDLDEARRLSPELKTIPVCQADLERVAGNPAAAREILEKHLVAFPGDPEACNTVGRCYLDEGRVDEAGRWFDRAIEAEPGNSTAWRNKMALYGKDAATFAKNRKKMAELRQMADRADPESAYSNLMEEGYACQAGGDFAGAEACFAEARRTEPDRLEAFVASGYLAQQQKQYADAQGFYAECLRLAPGAIDGYWNMAALLAEQEHYTDAAEWYEKALPQCPLFTRTLLVKAGEMYAAAGDFDKAVASCLRSLELDPDFDFALNTLHDLSDRLRDKGYTEKTGTAAALAVLEAIRNIKGEVYEAAYRNRIGNVYYYFADYAAATASYRLAIAADAEVAVYFDNLAGALDKLADAGNNPAETFSEALLAAEAAARLESGSEAYRQLAERLGRKLASWQHFGVLPEERSAQLFSIRVRFREDLYPWMVQADNLVPALLQPIEAMREKFRAAYGITLPGVRFSSDWNIAADANFVIDLEGIPMQQGWLEFSETNAADNYTFLVTLLEQNIQANLADFIHYDSAEVSAKFVGKTAAHASGYFQLLRMLLKQRISIARVDTIHDIYEAGSREGKSIQAIAEAVRRHPDMLSDLPVNTDTSRSLLHLNTEQEESILASLGKSAGGQLLWQISPDDPVFYTVLEYLPKTDYALGEEGHYVTSRFPQVATLLNDLHPGTFFSRGEILHWNDAEKAAIPEP
jgi:tetratricopeptide (TPR) repeat protein